jgi:NAD-dependent DNA ligase
MLLGLVTGMVADDHLHDREIMFLNQWVMENPEAAVEWPGSALFYRVREALADGVITEPERAHLLRVLRELAVSDFSETGSAQPEPLSLPIQDVPIDVSGQGVCHTGLFLFGTREHCEALTAKAGGLPLATVTKKVQYLVVGTNVSPDWAHTSYGRKIEQAVALQAKGHGISIVSEQRWLQALGAVHAGA